MSDRFMDQEGEDVPIVPSPAPSPPAPSTDNPYLDYMEKGTAPAPSYSETDTPQPPWNIKLLREDMQNSGKEPDPTLDQKVPDKNLPYTLYREAQATQSNSSLLNNLFPEHFGGAKGGDGRVPLADIFSHAFSGEVKTAENFALPVPTPTEVANAKVRKLDPTPLATGAAQDQSISFERLLRESIARGETPSAR